MEKTRSAAADDGCIISTKLHAFYPILAAGIRVIFTAEVGQLGPTHPQPQLNRLVILLLCRLTLWESLGMVSKSTNQYLRLKSPLIILVSILLATYYSQNQHNPSRPMYI